MASAERQPIEGPVSILKINNTEVTGSLALMAYALLYVSRSKYTDCISQRELAAAQAASSTGLEYTDYRLRKNLNNLFSILEQEKIRVERLLVYTGRNGGEVAYRPLFTSTRARNKLFSNLKFEICDGKDFYGKGPNTDNSLRRQVRRLNPSDPAPEL